MGISANEVFRWLATGTLAWSVFIVLFLPAWAEKRVKHLPPLMAAVVACTGAVGVLSLMIGTICGTIGGNLEVVLGLLGVSIAILLVIATTTVALTDNIRQHQ